MNTGDKSVLDACCGSKMFWFDKTDSRAVYIDCRSEKLTATDSSKRGAGAIRHINIEPDLIADFRSLPFPERNFNLVVFDPPHLLRVGDGAYMRKRYGKLTPEWKEDISKGFDECFRVLKPGGTLVFKWNETNIPVSQILQLTPEKPLIGQRCGKSAKTHWIIFIKNP